LIERSFIITNSLILISFLRKFEISSEKSRKIKENQNNWRKFEEMKFLEKIGQITLRVARDCRPLHANIENGPEFFSVGNLLFGRSVTLFIIVSAGAALL
jgi:hypothetical protein